MNRVFVFSLFCFICSCSSRKIEHEYKIKDSSHNKVPYWIQSFDSYVSDTENSDFKFYKFQSSPKNSRAIACKVAQTQAASYAIGEIKTTIRDVFKISTEGGLNGTSKQLREYVSHTLEVDIVGVIRGLKVASFYWEKRAYLKELGASSDFEAWTCTVLVKLSKKNFKKALDKVESRVKDLAKN